MPADEICHSYESINTPPFQPFSSNHGYKRADANSGEENNENNPFVTPTRSYKFLVFSDTLKPVPRPPRRNRAPLRDITDSHLQECENQPKPISKVYSKLDLEAWNNDNNSESIIASRKRPRSPSSSPSKQENQKVETGNGLVLKSPMKLFDCVMRRQLDGKSRDAVSLRFLLKDFISTEKDIYNITMEEEPTIPVPPFSCTYSHNINEGRLLAVVDEIGVIGFINTNTDNTIEWNKPRDCFRAHENAIFEMKWRNDDNAILTASGDQTTRVWDTETRKCTAEFATHKCSVKSASFDPSNPNIIVTGSRDGSIMLWDLRCTGSAMNSTQHQYMSCSTRYKPVNIIKNAHLAVYPAPTKKKRRTVDTTPGSSQGEKSVTAVLFMAHRDRLVGSTGAADGLIKYWDVRMHGSHNKKSIPTPFATSVYTGPSQRPRGLSSLTLDSTGTRLFSVGLDNHIYMHDVNHLEVPLARYTSPTYLCKSFYIKTALSPCNQYLAAGSTSNHVYVWEIGQPDRAPYTLRGHCGEVTSVAWQQGSDGRGWEVSSCSDDATVRIWRVREQLAQECRKNENILGAGWGVSVEDSL